MPKFGQIPSPENIDESIDRLLKDLEGYGEVYNEMSAEMQEAWYDAEMEAECGKDREAAKKHLEEFLDVVKRFKEEK